MLINHPSSLGVNHRGNPWSQLQGNNEAEKEMSTKRKPKPMLSPLDVLVAHQKVGQADADSIALPLLIHLDIAHRGKGDANCANFLTKHLIIALTLGSKAGNRAFYDMAGAAYDALRKACSRPTDTLSFTTGEYQAVKTLVAAYLRIIPGVTVLAMNHACANAQRILDGMEQAAA